MSWQFWIDRELGYATGYDEMLESVSAEFGLSTKRRQQEIGDRKQYVAIWFRRNHWKFNRYHNLTKPANLFGVKDHSGVIHLANYRKPSKNFEKNTKLVAEFLRNY